MRNLRKALGAGVAVLAAIGFCGVAAAQSPQFHVMTIALPGGGVEQIHYTGPVAPQVSVSDMPAFAALPPLFATTSPFADLERISAMMDRQSERMLREAAALSTGATLPNVTAVNALPAGAQEYSFVATMNGSNVCSRSVEITSQGNGAAPHVVTHTSGDCGAAAAGPAPSFPVPTQLPTAPSPNNGPRMIMTKATGAQPYAARVEEASLN
jgi:hypothetical protein